MYKTCKSIEVPEKKKNSEFTEGPDGEATVSCANLSETVNFLWEKILQYFSYGNRIVASFSWQLCSEGSAGMKISLFFVVIVALWT